MQAYADGFALQACDCSDAMHTDHRHVLAGLIAGAHHEAIEAACDTSKSASDTAADWADTLREHLEHGLKRQLKNKKSRCADDMEGTDTSSSTLGSQPAYASGDRYEGSSERPSRPREGGWPGTGSRPDRNDDSVYDDSRSSGTSSASGFASASSPSSGISGGRVRVFTRASPGAFASGTGHVASEDGTVTLTRTSRGNR